MFHLRKSKTNNTKNANQTARCELKKNFSIEAKDTEMKNNFREIIQPLYLHESFQSFVFLII